MKLNDTSTRATLCAQLRKLRVQTVTAEYVGEGDEGQIGNPNFGSVEVSDDLKEAVLDLFYGLLGDYYAGWEINEGSFGEFVWNVIGDTIQLVHNERFESVETKERIL